MSEQPNMGIWFGQGEESLLEEIKATAKTTDDSFSSWMKDAARLRLVLGEVIEKSEREFQSEVEFRNLSRRALAKEVNQFSREWEVNCEQCDEIWSFESEEVARQFFDQHSEHTDHEPSKLLEHS